MGFRWSPSLLDGAQNISYWVYEYSLCLRLTFAMSASDARRLVVNIDPSSLFPYAVSLNADTVVLMGKHTKWNFELLPGTPKSCLRAQWTRPIHIRWNSKWEQGSAWYLLLVSMLQSWSSQTSEFSMCFLGLQVFKSSQLVGAQDNLGWCLWRMYSIHGATTSI